MKNDRRVVITGMGLLTSGGSGKDEVWRSVAEGRTGLTLKSYQVGGEEAGAFYAHDVKGFNVDRYGISSQALDEIRAWKEGDEIEDLYYFLAAVKMALDDSGLKIKDDNKYDTGLMLSHENMGMDHFYTKMINELSFTGSSKDKRPATKKEFLAAFYEKFHRTGYELQTFMPMFHVAKAFDLHGFSLFLNNACASGLYALEAASCAIKSGKCSAMIVASADRSSVYKQMWFNGLGMLAKDGLIRPFASDRSGFAIGEGACAMVLESAESAASRKTGVYAEYLGGGFVMEGWKVTYPDVSNDSYQKAMKRALVTARLGSSDVDLLVPHGVGTNITDRYEAKAICDVFGGGAKRPAVTALKPYIGHALGCTALVETAIMLAGLKNDKIPPTINREKPDGKLGVECVKEMLPADGVKVAMKTACGFAGYDAACVFRTRQE